MEPFELWFTHKGLYLLPDGTRVVAFWTTLGNDPRWWFLAEQSTTPGRLGEMKVVVYPNGSIYNFVPEWKGHIRLPIFRSHRIYGSKIFAGLNTSISTAPRDSHRQRSPQRCGQRLAAGAAEQQHPGVDKPEQVVPPRRRSHLSPARQRV